MQKKYYPDWREIVRYADGGPRPQVLVDTDQFKSVIAGLQAGQKLPPHAEGPAIFHFLEGNGQMIVGEERLSIQAGRPSLFRMVPCVVWRRPPSWLLWQCVYPRYEFV